MLTQQHHLVPASFWRHIHVGTSCSTSSRKVLNWIEIWRLCRPLQ
uniref:Uncharacterized protein n=1 Tax=Anguilla anguilla TaxID=7936 RepID=A0A0E9TVJ3_ANGAN